MLKGRTHQKIGLMNPPATSILYPALEYFFIKSPSVQRISAEGKELLKSAVFEAVGLFVLQPDAVLCSEGLPGEVSIVNVVTLLCALFGSAA